MSESSFVPRRTSHQPVHRATRSRRPAIGALVRRTLRGSGLLTGVAVAATGIAVASGVVVQDDAPADPTNAALSTATTDRGSEPVTGPARPDVGIDLGDRTVALSRSDQRTAVDPVKAARLNQASGGQTARTADLSGQDPRTVARRLLPSFGFSASQFSCLDSLYVSESGWDVHADNPSSDAYGIPQALPGAKMATAGPDWAANPRTQITWGLGYIKSSYGTPCGAWAFKQSHGWY